MFKQRLVVVLATFLVAFSVLCVGFTKPVSASSLTGASVTMSNSRMSFKALISSGAAGASVVTIQSGSGDVNTNHLFPGDRVCFTDAGNNVCRDNTTYTVDSIISSTQFNITAPLTSALTATDFAVASQSGTWTVAFTTVNTVPIGGKLVITIPANDANTTAQDNDGMPDTSSAIGTNGFDMNKLGGALTNAVVTAGCTPGNWGSGSGAATSIVVGGGGTTDTVITWNRATSTCAGGTLINVTFGVAGTILNPAPLTSGHTQGTADVYGVIISTTDGTNIIDTSTPRVAPVEAVLISANVDESLSLVIGGLTGGSRTYCGSAKTYVTTTATSIPWGHLAAANTFYYAAQTVTVNTNATSGYVVTIQENDQMGRNGNTCTGTAPSAGQFTFSAGTCIRDTVCSAGTCSESTAQDWTDATTYPGLGYTEATIGATYLDSPFFYNEKTRTWSSKQLADVTQGGETAQTLMSDTGPVSNASAYVCYTLTIPGTQPAGYYYNIAKYTATATF